MASPLTPAISEPPVSGTGGMLPEMPKKGRPPERLVGPTGQWEALVQHALRVPRPKDGWPPRQTEKRAKSTKRRARK